MKKTWVKFAATAGYVGYSRFAPGTLGSLWGALIYYLLHFFPRFSLFVAAIIFIYIAVIISNEAEKVFGEKDCQKICIDEVAGQLVTYLFIPYSWAGLIIGFAFFRFFDWIKFFPANWAQNKIPGGYGVVADDVIAGLQAGVLFYIAFFWKT